jgi:formylglycine-generating enzyme required for sulfatase activity
VFLIYVDQGEELYARAEGQRRRRFSTILADGLADHRLRAMMSMRADFYGELQGDEPLYSVHRLINIPPMREAELRDVVRRPAELLSARFETPELAGNIARAAAEDFRALPLLSYLLDDMWRQMAQRGDGVLRLPPQSLELGSVLAQRADAFLARNPGYVQALHRIFTLKLVTIGAEGEPVRRRAHRSEFSDEEWRLITELADHPNRLLVTATSGADEAYAEVAHEALLRRWPTLRRWIDDERDFLIWRGKLDARRWDYEKASPRQQRQALLIGLPLDTAKKWLAARRGDIDPAGQAFIEASVRAERAAARNRQRLQAAVGVLMLGVIVGLIGWINQSFIATQWRWWTVTRPFIVSQVRPYVLPAAAEQGLKPGSSFRECAAGCPEMIVIPAGSFLMGSKETEKNRYSNEGPQHQVTIAQPVAVSKFELTFDEWDTCAAYGDCGLKISDAGWGRGPRPAIFVSWDDAQQYVAWLSRMTGKHYRLLSEAEYEYATRGGTTTTFPWGNDIGQNHANCDGCGSQWDNKQTAPVGSFAPNGFGLYDMVGNVFEWTEDCYHDSYSGAPTDGSAWTASDCSARVVRGGSWRSNPEELRSASRNSGTAENRNSNLGFRIGRTLAR